MRNFIAVLWLIGSALFFVAAILNLYLTLKGK